MITYKLYISESDNLDTVANAEANGTLKDQGVDVEQLVADNLVDGTQYYYNVVAEDSVGKSIYESNSVETVSADVAPTEAPTILGVTQGVTEAEVQYTEVDRATSYQFRINSGNSSIVTGNPFTVFNLQPDSQYNIEIRGVNAGGNGPWSDPVSFTTQQVSAPSQSPEILDFSWNLTTITVEYEPISDANGYEYRLNGSIISDIEFENPFTISGLAQNSTNTIEVRAYNAGGDGPWSELIEVTTDSEVVDQPVITSVENTEDPVVVTFDVVDFASGYDYRINGGVAIDIGTTNPFTVELDEDDEYTLEVRGYNDYGNGPWSEIETFTTDYTDPVISDTTLNVDSLDIDEFTLNFVKATDNLGQENLIYKYYEGDISLLNDLSTIENESLRQTATDVSQFVVSATEGEIVAGNVLVEDQAGNKAIYDAFEVLIPEQEVSDVEIYDQDPDVYTSEEPIAFFDPDGINGELSLSNQETIRVYLEVDTSEGADDTVSVTTSDDTALVITQVDDYTYDLDAGTFESGSKVNLIATSNFDSNFFAGIEVTLHEDSPVADTESATFELQTT